MGHNEAALSDLAAHAWDLYQRADRGALPHLVRPSIPVLFFGNSREYLSSPVKVITVGLNPSREEFPRPSPFSRFPTAANLLEATILDIDVYLASLDSYFRTRPYTRWFDPSFERILLGMGTSYYSRAESVALHTDLCTPLATDPTWSRLDPSERKVLEYEGRQIWHDLVNVLQPDVVLISVKRDYLATVAFPETGKPCTVYTVDGSNRKRPYLIKAVRRRLPSGKEPLFVFGQVVNIPFGSVSGEDKGLIGRKLLESLRA